MSEVSKVETGARFVEVNTMIPGVKFKVSTVTGDCALFAYNMLILTHLELVEFAKAAEQACKFSEAAYREFHDGEEIP